MSTFTKVVVYIGTGFFALAALLGLLTHSAALVNGGLFFGVGVALVAWGGMRAQRLADRPRADGSKLSGFGRFAVALAYLLLAALGSIGLLGCLTGQWILFKLALVLGGGIALIAWVSMRVRAAIDQPASSGGEVGRLEAMAARHDALNSGVSPATRRLMLVCAVVVAVLNVVAAVVRLLPLLLR